MSLSATLLNQLRAFEAVARQGSFKRAASELNVTESALSHHVRHLEEHLGIALLRRLHRRIEVTQEGQRLSMECTAGLQALERAVGQLTLADAQHTLTISVAPYFSARWLTPRLGRWWERHPNIDLQLRHAYQPADFLHDRVDGGISWGHGNWDEAEVRKVLPGELVAVCSPALAHALARGSALEALARQRLMCEFDRQHWDAWFRNAGHAVVSRKLDVIVIDDSHALRRAALDGHGVALFFRGLLQEDLASGQLVQMLAVKVDPGAAYYFVRPKGKPVGAKLAAFQRWLLEEVRRSPFA
ncbi:LysR substrate-binding domain-containing protein [Variovorax sp. J22R133]|uniref:LysR substrate-binding domain-containing protein n=1 Tax=Variovorax brevis TaxID=3053503 RepID=UPI002577CAF7|nr:LysR substrate-binding domain-containing protein [Variovorax sp. J22R133]MDM0116368.1 LysR substrate-binding domain-containing protein [Variovorax sp. J22R133]